MPLNRQGRPGLNQIYVSFTHRLKRCASAPVERLKPVDVAPHLPHEGLRFGAESRLSQTVISRDRMSSLCMRLLFRAVVIPRMFVFGRHRYLLHISSDDVCRVEKGGSG